MVYEWERENKHVHRHIDRFVCVPVLSLVMRWCETTKKYNNTFTETSTFLFSGTGFKVSPGK